MAKLQNKHKIPKWKLNYYWYIQYVRNTSVSQKTSSIVHWQWYAMTKNVISFKDGQFLTKVVLCRSVKNLSHKLLKLSKPASDVLPSIWKLLMIWTLFPLLKLFHSYPFFVLSLPSITGILQTSRVNTGGNVRISKNCSWCLYRWSTERSHRSMDWSAQWS